jgi:hypothetical protein
MIIIPKNIDLQDAAIHFVMGLILFFVSVAFLFMIQITTRQLCAPGDSPNQEDCFTRQAFRIVLGVSFKFHLIAH